MKRQINMCLFMSIISILIEIQFEIDINNDELSIYENVIRRKIVSGSA